MFNCVIIEFVVSYGSFLMSRVSVQLVVPLMLGSQWPLHKSALQARVKMKAPLAWETVIISWLAIIITFPQFRIHIAFKIPF